MVGIKNNHLGGSSCCAAGRIPVGDAVSPFMKEIGPMICLREKVALWKILM